MFYKIAPILLFGFFSFTLSPLIFSNAATSKSEAVAYTSSTNSIAEKTYDRLKANNFSLPTKESFSKAFNGFYKLKEKGLIQKDILTLVDFSKSSIEKRLWVIDLKNNIILFNSLVAHGKNSGSEFAASFSNKEESHKSSLGFYATGETYIGKHGYSLRLDGLENGINSNARDRAIVIHGAEYVSKSFIKQTGRLGRSFGCPALPTKIAKEVIDTIKDKSCLFIYYPS